MPYTPFYFGPGLLFKSVIPTRFLARASPDRKRLSGKEIAVFIPQYELGRPRRQAQRASLPQSHGRRLHRTL